MRASTMQLERREAIELVLSFQGLVAIASSNEAFDLSGACHRLLKLKRPNLKKVTKENWALNLKHHGARSCGKLWIV